MTKSFTIITQITQNYRQYKYINTIGNILLKLFLKMYF